MLGNISGDSISANRRTVLKGLGALGAATAGWSLSSGSASAAIGDSAVYQYYHTDWSTITANLSDVADAGYDAIQVPPAQFSRLYEYERNSNEYTYPQPLGYQPIDFTNFDSVFGTESEYQTMVDEAHNQGLEVIADAVMNHLAAGGDYFDRQVSMDDIPRFSSQDLHPSCSINYDDPESVEDCWLVGLRDLDQSSSYVRGELYNYLAKYANLGVDGVRFDAAKHIPEWFFRDYANQWADDLGLYKVGEVLDGSVASNQGYADTGMSVTDFALYFKMKEDVFHSSGDMTVLENAGLVNQDPMSALTFVSNHDKAPPEFEKLAYAYILTYEGYPRVYNHRIGPNDSDISNLLWIRRNVLSGTAETQHIDSDLYVYQRGDGLVALNNSSSARTQWVSTNFAANTELADCTGTAGNLTTNSDSWVQVTVPAQGYVVYSTTCVDSGGGGGGSDTVTLQIQAPTASGESVFFTGSNSDLTDWGGGVEGTNVSGDTWEVEVPDSGSFEWKARRGPSGGSGDVWESGDNHTSSDTSPSFNGWADGFTGGSGGGGTTVQDGATYAVQNVASGKALDVSGVSADNGANVHVWEYLEGGNQHWTAEATGDGYYRLTPNHTSGKCLDVSGGSGATQDGANVHQWDYFGNTNQQWSIESVDGGFLLRARHSGKVAEAMGTGDGADVQQQSEHGGDSQVWTLTQI